MKSAKIGFALFLVYIFSFTPSLLMLYKPGTVSGYFRATLLINNLANFFIYLVIDEEFRAKLKAMCKR